MKQNLVISIVGPTAVGKTDLAFYLVEQKALQEKFQGFDFIIADSRQVYQNLEIITGADIPEQLPPHVAIYGASLIKPNQEWSLAHFRKYGQKILSQSWANKRLPIIVGGTGLYHQHLFSQDETINIIPNIEIRNKAEKLSIEDLQIWLKSLNNDLFNQMNYSDQNNPRRLVRSIEVLLSNNLKIKKEKNEILHYNLTIGLTDNMDKIKEKIMLRVIKRLKNGAINEVEKLLTLTPPPTLPAISTAGVKEIEQLINGSASEEEVIEHWSRREYQYAKRQLTWWKKYGQVEWFDKQDASYLEKIVHYLKSQI